jgi:uncharacterized protein
VAAVNPKEGMWRRGPDVESTIYLVAPAQIRAYNGSMEYEWDRDKAEKNLQKHKIDFADAVTALDDEAALTLEDRDSYEERFVTIGMDAVGRLLVVVYNWRGERIRLISARRATRTERKQYEGKEL